MREKKEQPPGIGIIGGARAMKREEAERGKKCRRTSSNLLRPQGREELDFLATS